MRVTAHVDENTINRVARELEELLGGRLLVYEAALRSHGMNLPYPDPAINPEG